MKSHLKNLIQVKGAISISQLMNEALFHPQLGYYQSQDPFGKDGDFITAPEISQVFGELIGAYLISLWQNHYQCQEIHLVEMGAGRGTLASDLLIMARGVPNFLNVVKISIIEISQKLQEIQKHNLRDFNVTWYNNFADFYQKNSSSPIIFIANELFDCFAINQFIKIEDGWAEKMVRVEENGELEFCLNLDLHTHSLKKINSSIDLFRDHFLPATERLVWCSNPCVCLIHSGSALRSAPHLPPKNGFGRGLIQNIDLELHCLDYLSIKVGDIFECSPSAINFMDQLSKSIKQTKGLALIIDYGYIKNEFKNTLQALKNHQYCDILKEVGRCDITALVNFSTLQKIAQKNHLQTSLITQREFLQTLGVEMRREKLLLKKNTKQGGQINSAINRLIDPEQMGELFKVLITW